MQVTELTKQALKSILQTSEGFPVQSWDAAARLRRDAAGHAFLGPQKAQGHSLSSHVRGVEEAPGKTKFCSINDQVEALWLLLHTPAGMAALRDVAPGSRQTVKQDLPHAFPIQAPLPGGGLRTFTTQEQLRAGARTMRCVAVLEGRERAGRLYLHVHTCYPAVEQVKVAAMLAQRP